MAPPSAMRPSAPFLGAGASSAGGPSSVSASASAVPTGGSRIPVPPPRSIKREASESLTSVQARESPSLQRLHRLASLDSPAKFRKPTLLEDQQDGGSPALAASHAVRSLSLAPNCRSPLATPPGRRKSGIGGAGSVNVNRSSLKPTRLSMYGVPLSMVLGGSEVASRRGPNLLGGGSAGMIANGNAGFLSSPSLRDKRIVVCVRKRPLSSAEVRGGDDCVSVNDHDATVSISVLRTKLDGLNKYHEEYAFAFDRAYGELASNEQVYEEVVDPLVRFCVQGGRATCFAYGQTGSGKTHTMFHPRDGQCYLALADLLRRKERGLEVWVSFFEIYQSQLYDLLRGRKRVIPCERKDGQVTIMGLEEDMVVDEITAREIIQRGLAARMTGRTGANAQSSRSHAILQFTLRPRTSDPGAGPSATINSSAGDPLGSGSGRSIPSSSSSSTLPSSPALDVIYGRISFIDLAGSERGADRAEVDRRTKLEGSEINKSLLALKECIRALDLDAAHLPFRQSKLTLVLKDSIIGDVRTAMIATVSPATSSSEHSLNTLRYAERFHEISSISATAAPSLPPQSSRPGKPSSPSGGCLMAAPRMGDDPPSRGEDWLVSPLRGSTGGAGALLTGSTSHEVVRGMGQVRGTTTSPPPHHSRHVTPVKTVTFAMPMAAVEERKRQIDELLVSLRTQVQACQDDDVLEVLQEELANIGHAFRSLA